MVRRQIRISIDTDHPETRATIRNRRRTIGLIESGLPQAQQHTESHESPPTQLQRQPGGYERVQGRQLNVLSPGDNINGPFASELLGKLVGTMFMY